MKRIILGMLLIGLVGCADSKDSLQVGKCYRFAPGSASTTAQVYRIEKITKEIAVATNERTSEWNILFIPGELIIGEVNCKGHIKETE